MELKGTLFVGLFNVHPFLFVASDQLCAALSLDVPGLIQLKEQIFLIVIVIDVHLDAVLVVGSWKHQLPGMQFLAGEFPLTRFQLFHSVGISASKRDYLRVFMVFSDEEELGLTLQIMTVLQKPTKESLSTMVNLLPRKGVCALP